MAHTKPRRVRSLPSLRAQGGVERSPLAEPLTLCTATVRKRRVVLEHVLERGGHPRHSIQVVAERRMPFVAFERGVEWERPQAMARLPKAPLPPLKEILREVERMQLEPLSPKEKAARARRHTVAFGGSGRARPGPSLPILRPRLEVAYEPKDMLRSSELNSEQMGPDSSHVAVLHVETSRALAFKEKDSSQLDTKEQAASPIAGAASPVPETPKNIDDIELPFPWSDEELQEVFRKFDTDRDGEVHKDDLPAMLQYIGARRAPDAVSRIANNQTNYATLNFEEFLEFMSKFREFDVQKLREEFKQADTDGSGFLDFDELHHLLHQLGYAPTAQSSLEAMQEIDVDGNGEVSLLEFEGLREYLRKTEGMTKEDVEELRKLYDKSAGRSGSDREPIAEEVWHVTMYLGYAASLEEVQDIAKQVDSDGNSDISFSEMLKLIRRVREDEKSDMLEVLSRHGSDTSRLAIEDLGLALSDLGYFVSEEVVFDILDGLGAQENEDYLTLDELANFLRRYRLTEGFTQDELEELEGTFKRESRGPNSSLRTLDVGRVLRWYGFSRTVQQVQNLVKWIDFDCSGELELTEFLKLMRRMYQDEAKARFSMFDSLANKLTGEIPASAVSSAIARLYGAEPNPEFIDRALHGVASDVASGKRERRKSSASVSQSVGEEGAEEAAEAPALSYLNRVHFENFFRHYRQLVVDEIHANAGYSPAEVNHLRTTFASYDKDGSGTVERAELAKLLGEFFPDSTKSKKGQRQIQEAVAQVDRDGNGELDFNEFLFLMRKCDDARDANDLQLELQVVNAYEFSAEEVEGWRQIFTQNADTRGELPSETVVELLGNLVELTPEVVDDITRMVQEVHPEGREVARFPQFLTLIKQLTQDNYAYVNDLAAKAIVRGQSGKDTKR